MKILNALIMSLAFIILNGCTNTTEKPYLTSIDMPESLRDRSRLVKLFSSIDVLNKDRSLVHLAHTCNLHIDDHEYPVVNIRELVKGAVVPKGVNKIVVLNYAYQLVKTIEYSDEFPLFCEGNKLYLYGDLIVDGFSESGNVLQFEDGGYQLLLLKEDLNKKLPLPQ